MTGYMELPKLRYWVVRKKIKTFWGYKREYWVASDFSRLGVWDSYAEAYEQKLLMDRYA